MVFKEYGTDKNKIIVLLHGGGLSNWGYDEVAKLLSEEFRVILPVIDGHGGSGRGFKSIEENARHIIDFIDENFQGSVFAIGGLSLGGQIALEILSQRKDICSFAFIESALVIPSKITEALVKPMIDSFFFLIAKPWFAKLQFNYLKIKGQLYQQYYEDTCKISKTDMISFLKANSKYYLNPEIKETQAKVIILAGEKEQKNIIESAKIINNAIPGSSLEIITDLYHGQLSMNHPEKFVLILKKYINKNQDTLY